MASHKTYNDIIEDDDDMLPDFLETSEVTLDYDVPTRLHNLDTNPLRATNQKRASLPPGYVPGDADVVCGRGKRNWNHLGNINFRNIIRINTDRYIDSPTKNDKTLVVISIVDDIRRQGGRFLKQDFAGRWYDIGDAQARDKVGHSLRDQVSALNRQKKNKQVKDTVAAPPLVRRNSIRSDSGNETDVRRSAHITSFILNTFSRRPSFLAFSFGSQKSAQQRASVLMGGDEMAGIKMESMRRSSNWEFLDSLDEFMQDFSEPQMVEYEGGQANTEPLELSQEMGPYEVAFDHSQVNTQAQI